MTTPTSMGNHGGTVTSCSPYAHPGYAEICILHRTWPTVALGTYELAFLIKKKVEGKSGEMGGIGGKSGKMGEFLHTLSRNGGDLHVKAPMPETATVLDPRQRAVLGCVVGMGNHIDTYDCLFCKGECTDALWAEWDVYWKLPTIASTANFQILD